MSRDELIALAKSKASEAGLLPEVVCAIVEQESSWNPWAIRYEPRFFAKYVAPLYTNNHISVTEAYLRAFSWGLMQVMGQVAREHGYPGELAALCDPATGLEWGCKVLAHKLAIAQGNFREALLSWNGGSNTAYPDQVLARVDRYK